MRIVEISESKHRELAEGIGEMLCIGKRLMECIGSIDESDSEQPYQYGGRRMRQTSQMRYGRRSQPSQRYDHSGDYDEDPYM